MEQQESFYRQEVVCWSCLRIAMISTSFGWNKEREKFSGNMPDGETMRAVYKDFECNAAALFEIVDNVCFSLFVFFDSFYCPHLLPKSGKATRFHSCLLPFGLPPERIKIFILEANRGELTWRVP